MTGASLSLLASQPSSVSTDVWTLIVTPDLRGSLEVTSQHSQLEQEVIKLIRRATVSLTATHYQDHPESVCLTIPIVVRGKLYSSNEQSTNS